MGGPTPGLTHGHHRTFHLYPRRCVWTCLGFPACRGEQIRGSNIISTGFYNFLGRHAEAVASGPDWRALISQDILAALNGKGYRFFPNRQTDLLVAFHIVLVDNESVTTLDNYLGYPLTKGQSAQADLSRFQDPSHPGDASKGTLIIDFVDPKKKVLLWRGWAKTNVDLKQSGEKLQALAKQAVDQILAKFPSRR